MADQDAPSSVATRAVTAKRGVLVKVFELRTAVSFVWFHAIATVLSGGSLITQRVSWSYNDMK